MTSFLLNVIPDKARENISSVTNKAETGHE